MSGKIKNIYLSAERREGENFDAKNGSTDVIVLFENGEKWVASFFTINSIKALNLEHKETNEYLDGNYFWAKGMLLIDECSKKAVTQVVNHLLDEGTFTDAFLKL